jgi:hypothetical protein
MNRRAIPWLDHVDCCGERVKFDQHIEWYKSEDPAMRLPPAYERELEIFFQTRDKKKMLERAWKAKEVPVWCQNCHRVEIVDADSGDCVDNCERRNKMSSETKVGMKVARELALLAKELTAFWDLTIVPPSAADVSASKKAVETYLKSIGMKCDKLAFQRYMVYQENAECVGPQCARNSNKHLCVFGYEDKDGTFGGAVAGGRMGNPPKLYQPARSAKPGEWGIVGKGAAGEASLRRQIDMYIRKKTTQADGYTEVKVASVKMASSAVSSKVASELVKLAEEIGRGQGGQGKGMRCGPQDGSGPNQDCPKKDAE